MRSKAWVLKFGLLMLFSAWPIGAAAQEPAGRQLIVPLSDGGFVAFKSETAWADRDMTALKPQETPGAFAANALMDESHIIHRLLSEPKGSVVFGYDLLIEPRPGAKQFRITLSPLDTRFAEKLLAGSPADQPSLKQRAQISTLPRSAEPQILDDGDSFALDLLVNQHTGVKIVDIVKVTFDRSTLWDTTPGSVPRDFSLDAVELTVRDYRLLINGQVVSVGKPASDWSGALLWFYVGDRGRFIVSLVPREGYQFQKVGIIENNRIEFTIKGDRYEWISNAPLLPGGGTWNLWVLYDPKYTPLMHEAVPDPKKSKDKLDRIEEAVRKVAGLAGQSPGPIQTTLHPVAAAASASGNASGNDSPTVPPARRLRVVVGGADRIENLWPPMQ